MDRKSTLILFLSFIWSASGEWKPLQFLHNEHFQTKPIETITTYHGNFGQRSQPLGPLLESHKLLEDSEPRSVFSSGPLHQPHPVAGIPLTSLAQPADDHCGNYKVGFTQDLYFQYIQYKHIIPELKEFTLCMWTKFSNHSNDHPLFSYAVEGQPREILAWVSNTDRSSYFTMAVAGHTFFRLNYPIRLNKWYHNCHSWNGRTGEWQLWVNAERVGRGFHNRLVGHIIPAGGVAITGQEQRQVGGGFLEGNDAPKGSGGMLGEITMVQLYNVALTAGKAHKDHKHHHAHKFHHEGVSTTTTTPRPPPPPNQAQHPLLTGGQINPMLNLNFAGGQPTQPPQPQLISGQFNGQPLNSQLLNGQFLGRLVSEQLLTNAQQNINSNNGGITNGLQVQQFPAVTPRRPNPVINGGLVHPQLVNPANVQFIDTPTTRQQYLFKRDSSHVQPAESSKKVKRGLGDHAKAPEKLTTAESTLPENKHNKRGLVLVGDAIYEDTALANAGIDVALLDGLAVIGENQPVLQEQKERDEREPAEAEVKAVMNICTGCDEEPFEKALVFGWRTVPKKLYSGAFYAPAVPECKAF